MTHPQTERAIKVISTNSQAAELAALCETVAREREFCVSRIFEALSLREIHKSIAPEKHEEFVHDGAMRAGHAAAVIENQYTAFARRAEGMLSAHRRADYAAVKDQLPDTISEEEYNEKRSTAIAQWAVYGGQAALETIWFSARTLVACVRYNPDVEDALAERRRAADEAMTTVIAAQNGILSHAYTLLREVVSPGDKYPPLPEFLKSVNAYFDGSGVDPLANRSAVPVPVENSETGKEDIPTACGCATVPTVH